jgi:3-keto-disaccharide hydrolase
MYNDSMTIPPRRPTIWLAVIVAACAAVTVTAAGQTKTPPTQTDPKKEEWIQLFDGRDLDGWTPKFAKHDLGENLNDTFRVENGLLEVRYDKWTRFDGEFGHMFYKDPFSYYRLVAEYRFVGNQVPGGPAWAMRNNGLMLHCPNPKTMLKDQDFPISIEFQLLGGLSDGKPRSTANLCTPGSNVVMDGKLHTQHCTNSTSKTYDGDQWVHVEAVVHGDELVEHYVDGVKVLEYTKPQMGGGAASPVDPAVKIDGTPMASGFISIQAETAPADFRKIELLNLEGCMDPKASNYKTYFVKANPQACRY